MKRRRRYGKQKYSISYLLAKQPKTFIKDPHYSLMMNYYRNSESLQKVRFNRLCYSLLNNARIKPQYLNNFYRTYRLPKNPFFPLFFSIKVSYINKQEQRKIDKQNYIIEKMKNLPSDVVSCIKYMAELEKKNNYSRKYPVWLNSLFPKTKKQVNVFLKFSHREWFFFFKKHLQLLIKKYSKLDKSKKTKILACFILDCLPKNNINNFPDEAVVKKKYRLFSKKYHPDTGGDSRYFIKIKWARDVLL